MKILAHAGPMREKIMSKVDRSLPKTLIRKGDKVYEAHWSELRNLALSDHEIYSEINKRSIQRGLEDPYYLKRACLYCNNSRNNIQRLMENNGMDVLVIQDISEVEKECVYEPVTPFQIAIEHITRNHPRRRVRAIIDPCALEESLLEVLEERGLLDECRVEREFNFVTAYELEEGVVPPKDSERVIPFFEYYLEKVRTLFKKE
jgi:hypothetical protein